MTPKATSHVIQGMQKDTSKSKLSKEFAFDAKNIRITAREDNSLLTVTNEKGNKFTKPLFGSYLGHCVLNNQLVLFTTTPNAEINKDHIFLYDSDFRQISLYHGNLNFSLNNPLETLGVYENEEIQKVYWVDGRNQPRVINIKASKEVRAKWSDTSFDFIPELALQESVSVEAISNSSMFAPGVIQYAFSYYNKYGQESNIFYTTQLCYLAYNNRGASPEEVIRDRAFKIKVSNLDTNFEYIRIYSIHRTSLNAVPTVKRIIDFPISIPEETTNITETSNYYHVGSTNKAYIRRVGDLPSNVIDYNGKLITEVFNGTSTESGDVKTTTYYLNKSLLHTYDIVIGYYNEDTNEFTIEKVITGEISKFKYTETKRVLSNKLIIYSYDFSSSEGKYPIIINYEQTNTPYPSIEYIDSGNLGETIDPTQLLYIGGEDIIASTITQKDNTLFLGNIKLVRPSISDIIKEKLKNNSIITDTKVLYNSDKDYTNYNSFNCNYFKSGEQYRLGLQFQYKNGKWSEPVHLHDCMIPVGNYPELSSDKITVPSFKYEIPSNIKDSIIANGYKKVRGVVVIPDETDRLILTQGLLCPTVYSVDNREKNSPYSQASWFIRPFDNTTDFLKGAKYEDSYLAEFRHGYSLISGADFRSEIQNKVDYKIDQSVLNLYSPEIEFLPNEIQSDISNIKLRIVGIINFTSNYSDIDIQTKTGTFVNNALGFVKKKLTSTEKGFGAISGLYYKDGDPYDNNISYSFNYLITPWSRSGSLNSDSVSIASNDNNRQQTAVLKTKKLSNYKISKFNTWLDKDKIWEASGENRIYSSYANGITNVYKADSDQINLTKIKEGDYEYNYYNNIDTLETSTDTYPIYYVEDSNKGEIKKSESTYSDPVRIKYKTAPHLVFKLNKNNILGHTIILPTVNNLYKITGIIEEDVPTTDISEYGAYVKYADLKRATPPKDAETGDLCFIWCTNSNLKDFVDDYHYNAHAANAYNLFLIKKIVTGKGWELYDNTIAYFYSGEYTIDVYKRESTYVVNWKFYKTVNITPPDSDYVEIKQDSINIENLNYPYLFLAELYKDKEFIQNPFGGNTEESIKNNIWLPAGDSISLDYSNDVNFIYGDTRYQRYDCLKTYAFTPEDENQVVEIVSFMCETRVNLLGRYDKNIGNLSNLNADPTNFNLFNPVYSQKDNFFNYRILDSDLYKLDKFNNTITWSKEKFYGEQVDTWTNITMASTLDLDGTKGKVNKLITFKDQIFAFQDKGISNILFNSRVQIPVSDGVPVEISNGMKVDGSRYISDNIGCQNKNSIITTPSGVYFLDSESNGIYLLADGLTNLSTNKGFDIWTKEVSKDPSFKSFYDKNEKDVYFTTKDYCLGYSEKLGQFTSFYDYTDVETMFNIGTGFYSIKADSVGSHSIYQHSIGNYNEFYGEIKPYHLTIISNEDPQVDKVFTNLDYRADFFDSNNNYLENESFDTLEVWNEYQRGKETLKYSKFRPSNLKKKFRMWGANIPRDKKNKLDRMRNPWLYIKLSKEKPGTSKMELHDLVVKYLE